MLRSTIDKLLLSPLRVNLPKLRNRHFLIIDIVVLSITPILALMVRIDGSAVLAPYAAVLIAYTIVAMVVRLAIFYPCGLYSRYWRYATVDELLMTLWAVFCSTVGLTALCYFTMRTTGPLFHLAQQIALACGLKDQVGLPLSIPLLDGLLVLLSVGSTRFSVRIAYRVPSASHAIDAKSVLIVGAGVVGQITAKELRSNPDLGLRPIGFIDDDPNKQHLHVANLPVLGGREVLPEVVREYGIDQVVIAISTAPGKTIRTFLQLCEEAGVPARTVPSVSAILEDKVRVSSLRNVEIEDLLRREPIRTDVAAVRGFINGARVLVTGGGGSIGSELCRQVFRWGPSEIIILGHGENSVFDTHNELKRLQARAAGPSSNGSGQSENTKLSPVIADIRDRDRIRSVIRQYRPDIIFHTAAHKHVPLMELNPGEAITNNVFGTRHLLDASVDGGVEHFVMISTDKAVNPTSVMGASKRAAELLVLEEAKRSGKCYVVVRFGNVLGSRGSVVPTFRRQIVEGGPVTVSHPDMTRYFMTIPEAVQLVLQASVLGKGGEVFMLDMGEPVKIVDLARDLIELSGLEVGRDIDIVFTGVRPGEKLFEELLIDGESYQPTLHEKIRIARDASPAVPPKIGEALVALDAAAARSNRLDVLDWLRELIPEFQPDELRNQAASPPDPAVTARTPAARSTIPLPDAVGHNRRPIAVPP